MAAETVRTDRNSVEREHRFISQLIEYSLEERENCAMREWKYVPAEIQWQPKTTTTTATTAIPAMRSAMCNSVNNIFSLLLLIRQWHFAHKLTYTHTHSPRATERHFHPFCRTVERVKINKCVCIQKEASNLTLTADGTYKGTYNAIRGSKKWLTNDATRKYQSMRRLNYVNLIVVLHLHSTRTQ